MTHEQLKIYVEILEDLADSWMLEAANKKMNDLVNPDKQKTELIARMNKAKEKYDALFSVGWLDEARKHYEDYLFLKSLIIVDKLERGKP